MSDVVIRVENLSKLYHVGERAGAYRYKALLDVFTDAFAAPFRRLSGKEPELLSFSRSALSNTACSSL